MPALVPEGSAATAIVFETRVGASSDDAEESSSGSVATTTNDLELGVDKSAQTVGLRFGNIPVPKGATITASWIQFEVDQRKSMASSLVIRGQAADNAVGFTTTTIEHLLETKNGGLRPLVASRLDEHP